MHPHLERFMLCSRRGLQKEAIQSLSDFIVGDDNLGTDAVVAGQTQANPTPASLGGRYPLTASGMSPTDPRGAAGPTPDVTHLYTALAGLSQELRGRALNALQDWLDAMRSGNDATVSTAASALATVLGEMQVARDTSTAKTVFVGSGHALPSARFSELHKAMHTERTDKDDAKVVEAVLGMRR